MPVILLPQPSPTPTATPPPDSPSPDLLAAIKVYWEATPSLTAIVDSPWFGNAPQGTGFPYVRITQTGERCRLTTGPGYFEEKSLLFSIYDTDFDAMAQYGDALTAAFDALNRTKDLAFNNGYLMAFRRTGGAPARLPKTGQGGSIVYQQTYAYMVMVGRTSP